MLSAGHMMISPDLVPVYSEAGPAESTLDVWGLHEKVNVGSV